MFIVNLYSLDCYFNTKQTHCSLQTSYQVWTYHTFMIIYKIRSHLLKIPYQVTV